MTPTFVCQILNDLRDLTDERLTQAGYMADVNMGRFCCTNTDEEALWDAVWRLIRAEQSRRASACKAV